MSFLDDQQFHEKLCDYFVSKEWWMFIYGPDSTIGKKMIQLEETYYSPGTPKNGDFHLYLTPGMGEIYLAKKSRVTLDQLKKIFPELPFQDLKQDVIGVMTKDSVRDALFYRETMEGIDTVLGIRRGK